MEFQYGVAWSVTVTPVPLTLVPPSSVPKIPLVDAVAFTWASKLADVQVFKLFVMITTPVNSKTTLVDISSIPAEYHESRDVFSNTCANTLPAHQSYNLKIELEEGTTPLFSLIYLLSPYKLQTLCEFIDKHLAYVFIRPLCSLCGAPVLFIKKKDGSFWLCVDFWGLNKIMKKDHYLISLTVLARLNSSSKSISSVKMPQYCKLI